MSLTFIAKVKFHGITLFLQATTNGWTSLGNWYTGVYLRVYDPDPSNPTTTLGFSPVDSPLHGTNTVIEIFVYRGIPSGLLSRPEQSHHLPGALLSGDYRQCMEFPMGVPPSTLEKRSLSSLGLFMNHFVDYSKKGVILDEIYPFGCGVYLSSDICRMRLAD